MTSTYYFVVYQNVRHGAEPTADVSNVILYDIHPVVWAAQPPVKYHKAYTTKIVFWTEIPQEVVDRSTVRRYFSVQGADDD